MNGNGNAFTSIAEKLGSALKQRRLAMGKFDYQIANAVPMKLGLYRELENGKAGPDHSALRPKNFARILDALACDDDTRELLQGYADAIRGKSIRQTRVIRGHASRTGNGKKPTTREHAATAVLPPNGDTEDPILAVWEYLRTKRKKPLPPARQFPLVWEPPSADAIDWKAFRHIVRERLEITGRTIDHIIDNVDIPIPSEVVNVPAYRRDVIPEVLLGSNEPTHVAGASTIAFLIAKYCDIPLPRAKRGNIRSTNGERSFGK